MVIVYEVSFIGLLTWAWIMYKIETCDDPDDGYPY
jgi:hypothetical protein